MNDFCCFEIHTFDFLRITDQFIVVIPHSVCDSRIFTTRRINCDYVIGNINFMTTVTKKRTQKFYIAKTKINKMLISEKLLLSYGAKLETFKRGDVIFDEGDVPKYYYQIVKGRIKLNHYNETGKELILAILHPGLSVCELLLFIDKKYPVNAVVFEASTILKLEKSEFENMLDEHPSISRDINRFLSERLYYKFVMLENNASLYAEVRLKGVMDYHKSFSPDTSKFSYKIPLTRQQLASITGLRVETVIRTIKNLEKQEVLKIINRQILY